MFLKGWIIKNHLMKVFLIIGCKKVNKQNSTQAVLHRLLNKKRGCLKSILSPDLFRQALWHLRQPLVIIANLHLESTLQTV